MPFDSRGFLQCRDCNAFFTARGSSRNSERLGKASLTQRQIARWPHAVHGCRCNLQLRGRSGSDAQRYLLTSCESSGGSKNLRCAARQALATVPGPISLRPARPPADSSSPPGRRSGRPRRRRRPCAAVLRACRAGHIGGCRLAGDVLPGDVLDRESIPEMLRTADAAASSERHGGQNALERPQAKRRLAVRQCAPAVPYK
jgi:hypothetical protein